VNALEASPAPQRVSASTRPGEELVLRAFEKAFSCANRGSTLYRVKLMEIAR